MKAHIAVDADSGLVHTVTTTAASEADVDRVADLLRGKECKRHWDDSALKALPCPLNFPLPRYLMVSKVS